MLDRLAVFARVCLLCAVRADCGTCGDAYTHGRSQPPVRAHLHSLRAVNCQPSGGQCLTLRSASRARAGG